MTDFVLRSASPAETEALASILHDADEDDMRIRAALGDNALHSYAAYESGELVGAAVVQWEGAGDSGKSEIVLLAVISARRRQGVGKRVVAALLDEARRRSAKVLLVGTGSYPVDNLAFYQKCGFRMSHIRRDHFDYVQPPLIVDGVTLRDMVMLAYTV